MKLALPRIAQGEPPRTRRTSPPNMWFPAGGAATRHHVGLPRSDPVSRVASSHRTGRPTHPRMSLVAETELPDRPAQRVFGTERHRRDRELFVRLKEHDDQHAREE